jgi:uncharacterized protein (DUF983 family)
MENTSKGMPQFSTAEFARSGAAMTCPACKRPINGQYFQVNRTPVCAECAAKFQKAIPKDSHAAFVRAALFGAAGAVIGFALYVIFALATGLVIGFVSLAVGYIVGKAMNMGSRGVGGRRYQIVAVLLTYLAVSMSAVPLAIHQMQQHARAKAAQTQSAAQAAPSSQAEPGAQTQPTDAAPPKPREMNVAKAVGVLALLGIASPFLELQDPAHGIIGLIILFVGMQFAWRFTAGKTVSVSGPYTPSPAGSV